VSGTTSSLRGVSAVNAWVVWASGAGGTYLVTIDGGEHWRAGAVPGAEKRDFRAVHAVDDHTALLVSAGEGEESAVYKTTDAGQHWRLVWTNPNAKGFFDAIAFWDARRGVVLSDPVEGIFRLFHFFHSTDAGAHWTAIATPIPSDGPGAGIFSLAFTASRNAIAVGGDYSKPADTTRNIAISADRGRTWRAPRGNPPAGYRSAVAYLKDGKAWVATGTSGSDISFDGGETWRPFDTGAYNALAFIDSQAGWAVSPKGRIARFALK